MKDFRNEYRQKLRSPEEAVAVVKDGDWIDYTSCLGKPILLDRVKKYKVRDQDSFDFDLFILGKNDILIHDVNGIEGTFVTLTLPRQKSINFIKAL